MIEIRLGEYALFYKAYTWCDEQFGPAENNEDGTKLSSEGRWDYAEFGPEFYFNDEKDAMLFALKWA